MKLAVTGDGRADKARGADDGRRGCSSLREIPKPADAADALALACCHHGRVRMLDRIPVDRVQA